MKQKKGVVKRVIFLKTLGLLTALSLVTVTMFAIYMNQVVVKSKEENINDLNLHQLQRISSDVELVFDLLSQGMTQSMWSSDFVDLMIAPYQNNADLAYCVIKALSDQVEENDLVRKAYFYLPYSDQVYVYSGTYMELKYLGDRDIIYEYLDIREDGREAEATSEWRVLLYNRRIFLATDFCLPNFVGVLFYEINRSELYDIIQAENESFDTTIYVCDAEGGLLFDYMAEGPQAEDFVDSRKFLTFENEENSQAVYYMYTSEILGWKFLVRINSGDRVVSLSTLFSLILPGLIAYILVSQFFSIYITRSIYVPINRLIQIVTDPETRRKKERCGKENSEVDFLELAYLNSLDKNERYQTLMSNISGDMLEQLLRNLLYGRNQNIEQVLHALESIGRMDFSRGYYIVMVVDIVYGEKEVSLVEQELYQRSLLKILSSFSSEEAMEALSMGANRVVIVLCFAEEVSVYQIHQKANSLTGELCEAVKDLPYQIKVGKGRVYSDLLSIQFSYHEAVEDIQYLEYLVEDGQNPARVPYEQRCYTEYVRHSYSMAEKGKIREAKETIGLALDEILAREEGQRASLQNLIDDMIEKLILCRVSHEEIQVAGILSRLDEATLSGGADTRRFMEEFYDKTLRLIWESSRKSHNRYVEDAKEYIASHYAEGSLTLNEISEAVGLSPSYFSGIFAEVAGVGVNAWLNEYRIEQAKRFLDETSLNVSEIGYKCGFNSAQSFTRVFKKYTGMTPRGYREIPKQ